MPEAINGAGQVKGMNEQLKGSYGISRQGAASAYQPAAGAAEAVRLSGMEAPAFKAELSAVPDRSGDPQKEVQSIRQKLYQGVELSTEEMDFIEEHDENLYNKAQEAEDVRRELRSSLEKAGNGGEAQAIAQQAAKAVAQGMSSAGAVTAARENSVANIQAAGEKKDAAAELAATGSLSAANPAPQTKTASNQAAASTGSVNGTAQQGSAQEIIAMNAARGQTGANVAPNSGLTAMQSANGPVLNVTAPQQAGPNAIDHESGVLSANSTAMEAVATNSTNYSSVEQLETASSVTNSNAANQTYAAVASTSVPSAGSAAVTDVAAAAEAAASDPGIAENHVAEVSAVPTVAERISTGELKSAAQQSAGSTAPAQQEEERRTAAVRPMAGTGKTVQKTENKAAEAQQAMRQQREAAAQEKEAKAEAQQRSEARIQRFMKQQEAQQDAEPSKAVVNSRAVRRTWEQYTRNQQATAQGDAAGAVTAANNSAYEKIRSYNKLTDAR